VHLVEVEVSVSMADKGKYVCLVEVAVSAGIKN
jgi:hypothetical protein